MKLFGSLELRNYRRVLRSASNYGEPEWLQLILIQKAKAKRLRRQERNRSFVGEHVNSVHFTVHHQTALYMDCETRIFGDKNV